MRRLILTLSVLMISSACGDDATAPTTTTTTTTTIATVPATTTAATTTTASPPTTTTTTTTTVPDPLPLGELELAVVRVGGSFTAPLFLTVREGDERLYVANQDGVIQSMTREGEDVRQVIDLSSRVLYGGERGLLGLAFHPAEPGRMFVHYSQAGDGATVVAEYRLPEGSLASDREPVRTILTHPQPNSNHNGGMIVFGPDGYLYIGLGDGGGSGDVYGNAQDPHTLLGAILRIDVDGDEPYGIPADSPFADGQDGAPEVWLWGLRNPWRFSFDGNDMWIGDVGQGSREEIDLVGADQGGANLGWPILEGDRCYDGPQSLCDENDFVDPVYVYPRDSGRCSVIGGYVYRGLAHPELAGAYLFGDFCLGSVVAIRVEAGEVVEEREHSLGLGGLRSFGVDHDGEIYVTAGDGVYRIVVDG